ncbi:MAG: nucleotidyltransferase family protein [Propionicimonas sp.]|nr:nucleotidyltransferase family protein [Propionicimonas sp.]
MPSKRGRRRAVDALLVELCTGDAVEARVDARDADDLAAAARFHRIAPLAHVRLREARPDLAAGLRGDRDRARMHHLRVCATVAGLAGVLDGLEWLVFKGPVLSQVAHPVPGLRSYNDLDLLVAPDRLRETCSRLYEAGWRAVFDTDLLRGPELPGELALIGAAGLWLDLHWSVVLAQSSRRRSPVSTDELVERRVPVGLGGVTVATFDPADSLLHVCHHAALTGAKRLLHLLDADRLARRVEDWDEVVRRARAWHIQAELALVLGRARRLLVTPVPPDLNRRLGLSAGFGLRPG